MHYTDCTVYIVCVYVHVCVLLLLLCRINIPYAMRAHYTDMYRNPESTLATMSVEDSISVFDACIPELVKLLRDSFSRFVKTQEFQKCVEMLGT